MSPAGLLSPLRIPHEIVKAQHGENDGFVSLFSARWGEYIQTLPVDHFGLTRARRIITAAASTMSSASKRVSNTGGSDLSQTPKSTAKTAASAAKTPEEVYRQRIVEIMNRLHGPESYDDYIYGYEHQIVQGSADISLPQSANSSDGGQQKHHQQTAQFDVVSFYLSLVTRLQRQGF
jgi:hypothetical protein